MSRLLTKQDVAEYLGIHPESLMRWVRDGRFPAPIKFHPSIRSHVRFDPAEVEQWLERCKSEGNYRTRKSSS